MNARKLHIGCGEKRLSGWLNIDIEGNAADLHHDMMNPLPFPTGSVELVYNEHFLEHLTAEQGVAALREFHRVLRVGGVLRVAMPDLRYILFRYFWRWRAQEWIKRYDYDHLQTPAEMVNLCFHEWGHRHLYDHPELIRRLREAGFHRWRRASFGRSVHAELRRLETRGDSKLIVEAVR